MNTDFGTDQSSVFLILYLIPEVRSSTLHSTSVRCRMTSIGKSSSLAALLLPLVPRPSSLRRWWAGSACTVTWTRPVRCLGTSSRSSRDCEGSSSDSPSRFHCELLELSGLALLVALRLVPPMVMIAEFFGCCERPLLDPPALDDQADLQRSRARGP